MNLAIYNQLKTPPTDALKKITGGRLSGMTDINPQWRYEKLTEIFGSIGFGWKYQIIRFDQIDHDGQIALMAEIALFVKIDGQWSDPIPGIGGSTIVAKESGGLRLNDEAWKMAVTDALSVAMKMLGVGADIYRGYSDSKYVKPAEKPSGTNGNGKPNSNGQKTLTREEWEARRREAAEKKDWEARSKEVAQLRDRGDEWRSGYE